jgi:hypothetical protein
LRITAFSAPITLPFKFPFYGVEKSLIYVGANGVVGFSADGLSATENMPMANGAAPNDFIAPYWDKPGPGSRRKCLCRYGRHRAEPTLCGFMGERSTRYNNDVSDLSDDPG